jgi:hypothetical protein
MGSTVGGDLGQAIKVDLLGNVYTAGLLNSCDMDPGPGVYNVTPGNGAYVQKLDAQGNFVWGKVIDGPGFPDIKSMVIDNSGNIYVTGEFRGTNDFDTDQSSTARL